MSNIDKRALTSRLPIVAIGEWLMVLPATVLLAAAALRLVGGRGLPARISWTVFGWATTHVSRAGAALLAGAILAAVVAHVITD